MSVMLRSPGHDDVIKWKHFPRYWPFVRGIHRSPVNSPHKGQWRGALVFTLICVWINDCVNNGEAGDLRRYCAHYGVTVMRRRSWLWRHNNIYLHLCSRIIIVINRHKSGMHNTFIYSQVFRESASPYPRYPNILPRWELLTTRRNARLRRVTFDDFVE